MTKVIHYGIIGCGMMGQEHLRNILPTEHFMEQNPVQNVARKAR